MDAVLDTWLRQQHAESVALNADSDVLALHPEPGEFPPRRYLARFNGATMVRERGRVVRTQGFDVLIQFPADYLRRVPDAARIVGLLAPRNAFHPNVAPPFVCTGHLQPGTGLREIVYQVYEILTFQRFTPREDDALNPDACVWARNHMHLFPLDARALRRRAAKFTVAEMESGADA